jgi:uncharacterized membrane protein HdeD (DUF308 family)
MDSPLEQFEKLAETQVTKLRWAVGINGLLSVALGVMILAWPGISVYALTIVFGAYSLATGVVGLFNAFRSELKEERGWLIVSSLLGIAVGVMVLVWPSISALALLYVIGAYAFALGFLLIYGAFQLPLNGTDSALMILSGIISILFAIVIFAKPGTGVLVTLSLIAAFALVTGATQLVVAIGGKRLVEHKLEKWTSAESKPAPRRVQPSH